MPDGYRVMSCSEEDLAEKVEELKKKGYYVVGNAVCPIRARPCRKTAPKRASAAAEDRQRPAGA